MDGAEIPETRFVSVGESEVGYQVLGDGPFDLLCFWGLGFHLILQWRWPPLAAVMRRLASVCRVILFDRRGTGVSDAVPLGGVPTWEEFVEDITAVLDAVGSERAAIFALLDTGPMAIQFAAVHPERVISLVLGSTMARYLRDDDYPEGLPERVADALVEFIAHTWGTPEFRRGVAPDVPAADPEWNRSVLPMMCSSATPRSAAAQYGYILRRDVRPSLALIQAPTLVLHHRDNPLIPIAQARYLADHIDGARLVELPGAVVGLDSRQSEVWVGEMVEFLTGERPAVEVDRILTTILFTDICGSTQRAVEIGDHRWRTLLDDHDRLVREELRRFRGREINTTGDGFHVSFDGPARAIRCARAINEAVRRLGIEIRAGLHTGECEVRGDDLAGLAVHIAARVGALAGPSEVLVSSTVKDLVAGSGIEFADRGDVELRGVPATWRLYAVQG